MDRPDKNPGTTVYKTTGCGKLYVTDNTDGEFPEVFINGPGKGGGCPSSFLNSIARLISFAVRAGVPKSKIVQALKGMRCPSPQWSNGVQILSCPDAVAQALEIESDDGKEDKP